MKFDSSHTRAGGYTPNAQHLRDYCSDMLEGLCELAQQADDKELHTLLALTNQAVQTLNRA